MKRIATAIAGVVMTLGLVGLAPTFVVSPANADPTDTPTASPTCDDSTYCGQPEPSPTPSVTPTPPTSEQIMCAVTEDKFEAATSAINALNTAYSDLAAKYVQRGARIERQKAKLAELRERLRAAQS